MRTARRPDAFVAAPGTLYVVATPLGNLRDLTLRAVDVLGSADVIAAEDTRVTGVLLRHFGIATRPISLHEHNEAARAEGIVRELRAGKSVALVSDAGTPAISDPGARLVRAVRAAGFPVVPVPGACAAIAAVSAAGLAAERLLFLGFLPAAAKARRELLASVARTSAALVIYEAPHRVRATVAALARGAPRRALARRRARDHEEIRDDRADDARGGARLVRSRSEPRARRVRAARRCARRRRPRRAARRALDVDRLLAALVVELPPARAARVAAAATGLPRDALYAQALALKAAAR